MCRVVSWVCSFMGNAPQRPPAVRNAAPSVNAQAPPPASDLDLASVLGHELRNPLSALVNAHALLARVQPMPEAARAALAMAQRKAIELAVSDDGCGVAPDQVERIFELFAQADGTMDRPRRGLGLGLACGCPGVAPSALPQRAATAPRYPALP